jgi:hypothetical protein
VQCSCYYWWIFICSSVSDIKHKQKITRSTIVKNTQKAHWSQK